MKLSRNDFDPNLIEKIERLDKVVNSFTDEDRSGFLAYNGQDFFIRHTSDVYLRKIITESELKKYEKSLLKDEFKNSFSGNMNLHNVSISNFETLSVSIYEQNLYETKSKIVLFKKENNYLYFFTSDGILIKYDIENKIKVDVANIIGYMKENFTVSSISGFDFLAIEVHEEKVLLSTRYNGVLLYDFQQKELEVRFPDNDVVIIKYLGDNKILLGLERTESNILFYNFETGMKTETYNNLKKKNLQIPHLVEKTEDKLFVLGSPYALNTTKHLLHYWKKDLAGVDYNLADGEVYSGKDLMNHSIRDMIINGNRLFLTGLKSSGDLFI
jgi:hypothetical protein